MFIKTNAAALCLIFALVSITYGVVACGVATSATVDGPGQSVAAMNGWLTTTKWVGGGLQTVGIAGACAFTALACFVGLVALAAID